MESFALGSFLLMCGILCLGVALSIGIVIGYMVFAFTQYIKEEQEDWKRR